MPKLQRREFLIGGALVTGATLLTSRLAFARTGASSRFVFVILRGGLDGLSAVPPYADPDYATLRRELALGAPGSAGGVLKLDGTFGLHPSLQFLHESFTARELIVLHAVASPYRERSHFDAQDVLENGYARAHAAQSGWLNRALASLPSQRKELGVALGQNVPLVMRGPASVTSWSPSRLAALDEDTLDRIADLYASDALLSKRLADALSANAIATAGDESEESMLAPREKGNVRGGARYLEVVRAAAGFLKREDGPQVAVFDTTGWDTHANQGAAQGQLAIRLTALDRGLRTLKEQLGPMWSETMVVVATEFGRTAAANGTRGTDHGTAAATFVLGGAVQGGRVIADWPGLATGALHEQRDLKPTLDIRAVLKGALGDHLQVSNATLEGSVFPDSAAAKPLAGLTRG